MSYRTYKPIFQKQMLTGNAELPPGVKENVPESVLTKWHTQFWTQTHEPPSLSGPGRLLNHFTIGSDPEFYFQDKGAREKLPAFSLGLKVGLAAGCDQNERLVELRPWPSRSVVKHLAGILVALRWLYETAPAVRHTNWKAGAFFDADGIGGHVHFGRKGPNRAEEIDALDGLAVTFAAAGLFHLKGWTSRIMGDAHHQRYGHFSDVRLQRHGFEYRTLPSWLDSPVQAFIVLTASKLAMLDPAITKNWHLLAAEWKTRVLAIRQLTALAKYYKGRDDDAAILYHVLTSRLFVPGDWQFLGTDFKNRWGIPLISDTKNFLKSNYILPSSIPPNKEDIEDISNYLLYKTKIPTRIPPDTFVHEVPRNYGWLPSLYLPNRVPGLGDLIHDMVDYEALRFNIVQRPGGDIEGKFLVPTIISSRWSDSEKKLANTLFPYEEYNKAILYIPREVFKHRFSALRTYLLDLGLFPLWRVPDVTPDSFTNWITKHPFKEARVKTKQERIL